MRQLLFHAEQKLPRRNTYHYAKRSLRSRNRENVRQRDWKLKLRNTVPHQELLDLPDHHLESTCQLHPHGRVFWYVFVHACLKASLTEHQCYKTLLNTANTMRQQKVMGEFLPHRKLRYAL